jgi:ATP/maltotriose-dependent transcriptional regulator MalT
MEDYAVAERELRGAVEDTRDAGMIGELPYALVALAGYEVRTGDWLGARAHAAEALELTRTEDRPLGFALSHLAPVEAVTGQVDAARGRLEDCVRAGEQTGAVYLLTYSHAFLGLLELGAGDPRRAVEHLDRTRRLATRQGLGEPNVIQWEPDLVESLVRAGEETRAERALASFEHRAAGSRRPWALAAAARCRGLLSDEVGLDAAFEHAERLTLGQPSPFERERLHLCWGERLRRAGRRVDSGATSAWRWTPSSRSAPARGRIVPCGSSGPAGRGRAAVRRRAAPS